MGAEDDGPGNMNNVNENENPIMYPIEQYNRTNYLSSSGWMPGAGIPGLF